MQGFAGYIAGRLVGTVATVLAGAIAIFLIMKAGPGDPALFVLGDYASPAAVADFRKANHLDEPVLTQLWIWLTGVLQGDFGQSLSLLRGRDVTTLIASRLPNTAFLGLYAMVLALVLSLAAGTVAAVKRGQAADMIVTSVAVMGISMPDFWLSYVLVLLFALTLGILPAYGFVSPIESLPGALETGLLPALAIAAPLTAVFTRTLRVSLLETIQRDYVTAARSFGFAGPFIFLHFVFRNALIPFVTVVGLQIRFLLGGVVVIERIFGVPGIGSLMVDAAFARDYLVVEACAVVFLVVVLLVNLTVDVVCALLDPRRTR